jgi:predicted  nucleic acid-binding Zn-ribbon protein
MRIFFIFFQRDKLSESVKSLKSKIKELNTKIQRLEAEIQNKASEDASVLDESVEILNDEIQDLKLEKVKANLMIDSLEKTEKHLKEKIKSLENDQQIRTSIVDNEYVVDKKLNDLKTKIQSLESKK